MSSPIELTLRPSVTAGLLAAVPWLLLSGFLLAAAQAGKPWLLLALPATLAGGVWQYRHTGLLQSRTAVTSLRVEEGQLYVGLGEAPAIPVVASGASRIGARVSLLKLRPVGTRFRAYSSLLLATSAWFPGNVPDNEFRRLRVWLRLGRSRQSPP